MKIHIYDDTYEIFGNAVDDQTWSIDDGVMTAWQQIDVKAT